MIQNQMEVVKEIDYETNKEQYSYIKSSPAIIKYGSGYLAVCRTVNYTMEGAINFRSLDNDGIIKTKNILVAMDENFATLWQKDIVDTSGISKEKVIIEGMEDCRFVHITGERYAISFTSFEYNKEKKPCISLGIFDLCEEKEHISVHTIYTFDEFGKVEKNWLPLIKNERLYYIYKSSPVMVLRSEEKITGELPSRITLNHEYIHPYPKDELKSRCKDMRGGSSPSLITEGVYQGCYMYSIHTVDHHQDRSRTYRHRIVIVNDSFEIQYVSREFHFDEVIFLSRNKSLLSERIEFCVGHVIEGEDIIFSVGISDKHSMLYRCRWDHLVC